MEYLHSEWNQPPICDFVAQIVRAASLVLFHTFRAMFVSPVDKRWVQSRQMSPVVDALTKACFPSGFVSSGKHDAKSCRTWRESTMYNPGWKVPRCEAHFSIVKMRGCQVPVTGMKSHIWSTEKLFPRVNWRPYRCQMKVIPQVVCQEQAARLQGILEGSFPNCLGMYSIHQENCSVPCWTSVTKTRISEWNDFKFYKVASK